MKPALRRFGRGEHPVVIIDDFSGDVRATIDTAAALAPYPSVAHNYYPGLRRIITEADEVANAYVDRTLERAAQFIAGAFDCDGFDFIEASFSMVTADPDALEPRQRAPHFDPTDPKYLAVLHYLNVGRGTGTAFYRQRSTGIERVTESNLGTFVRTARQDAANLPAGSGYIEGSDDYFEQIGAVDAIVDRLIIYQGGLLHSGIIPEDMNRSSDPRLGRLTANLFVRAH
jgi:hypothetical protein